MSKNTLAKTYEIENRHKETVYRSFESKWKSVLSKVKEKQEKAEEGSYDEHDTFMVYDSLAGEYKKLNAQHDLIEKLYRKPYFAHIETKTDDDNSPRTEQFYLSDCEKLQEIVYIGDDGYLIPFKKDWARPFSVALFHCYQEKKGKPFSIPGDKMEYVYTPRIINDVEIENRVLKKATPLFPEPVITADALLALKLEENRDNPALKNIIATLQRQQFEIIEADENTSFVVQGCAGSGKSQCLLHRLFYLRDRLSNDGWAHVLLITPSKLFRNYSADLIRRYQLKDVENLSMPELYQSLLMFYDDRFKNRQYLFEMTEEYLPDKYLKEIYDKAEIEAIDKEISKAIEHYFEAGCKALGVPMPERITSRLVALLIEGLDKALKEFDSRENLLMQDAVYVEKRQQYEQLEKQVDSLRKRRERMADESKSKEKENKKIEDLREAVNEALKEQKEWIESRKNSLAAAAKKVQELVAEWNESNDIQLPSRYARQIYLANDLLKGQKSKDDEDFVLFLAEYVDQAQKELDEAIRSLETSAAANDTDAKLKEIDEKIRETAERAEELADWLRKQASEGSERTQGISVRRAELERARYFLSRIESTVFEQEVWSALAPIKARHHIQTIKVETLPDGHKKETKILYKADLLFYLKIYAALNPEKAMPDYRMFCIDEGQDFHKADYDVLHTLFPKAVFNVFGDIGQVLHTACGISDWKEETGIPIIYELDRNYRNTAAIVDYCNRSFESKMAYVGKVEDSAAPRKLETGEEIRDKVSAPDMVVIVKDRDALEKFCAKSGLSDIEFEFLDTKAELIQGGKTPCYTVFAAKGLEYKKVLVYLDGMTLNQKVVSCTRAMEELYYYE